MFDVKRAKLVKCRGMQRSVQHTVTVLGGGLETN